MERAQVVLSRLALAAAAWLAACSDGEPAPAPERVPAAGSAPAAAASPAPAGMALADAAEEVRAPAPRTASAAAPEPPAASEAPAPAPPGPEEPPDFARFVPLGEDEGRFEVAVTTYENDAGQRVSLVAAVHIADAAHYAALQEELARYDVVLYELVAEPDQRPKPGAPRPGSGGVLGMFQRALQRGLELEYQLDAIDYTQPNFVHADLTPRAFLAKMEERGESFFTIFWRMLQQELKRVQEIRGSGAEAPATFDLVSAFRKGESEGRHQLRLMVARQLETMEAVAAGIEPGAGTVLLEGRNERALEVLQTQLEHGHDRIAIYYGAAHMPGLARTLTEEMGFEPTGQRWLVAWDITRRSRSSPEKR